MLVDGGEGGSGNMGAYAERKAADCWSVCHDWDIRLQIVYDNGSCGVEAIAMISRDTFDAKRSS
jgi:hypothetical protein